ncbi:Conserved_hypothetical protein [Hexamita inflata]|uniref:Uncharacterized protein n=1 Tax=Hexamita inflata TaxID=28002 RepID=A0AA86UAK1_9EUKA|nr:Conserved hypothetical protein [Hexamita inflata]
MTEESLKQTINLIHSMDVNQLENKTVEQALIDINVLKIFGSFSDRQQIKQYLYQNLIQNYNAQIYYQLLFIDIPVTFTQILQENSIKELTLVIHAYNKQFIVELQSQLIPSNDANIFCFFNINSLLTPTITTFTLQQRIYQRETICQIQVSENEAIQFPRQIFLIDQPQQNILLSGLFSQNITFQRTRIQPNFDNLTESQSFNMVNDIIQKMKAKKLKVFLEFDLHLPTKVNKGAGNKYYKEYYKHINGPVMIKEVIIDIQVPDIQVHQDEVNLESVKRIMLDYDQFQTLDFTLKEISNFQFRYQFDGLILKGLQGIPHFALMYLDSQLMKMFPGMHILAYCDQDINFIKIQKIGKLKQFYYQYNNTLSDILSFNLLKNHSLIYQTKYINATINNISLLTLQNNSRERHQRYKLSSIQKPISSENRIVSVENSFETFMFDQLTQPVHIDQFTIDDLTVYIVRTKMAERFIFVNNGAQVQGKYLKNAKIDQYQTIKICPMVEYYLEPYENVTYAFENNNTKEQCTPSCYQDCLMLASELQHVQLTIQTHSVLIVDLLLCQKLDTRLNTIEIFKYLTQKDQLGAVQKASERALLYIAQKCDSKRLSTSENQEYIQDMFNYMLNSVYGQYLIMFDQASSKHLMVPSTFNNFQFKLTILSPQQLATLYPQIVLQRLIQTPLNEITVFGLNYDKLSMSSKRAMSILFPAFLDQEEKHEEKHQISSITAEDVLSGRFAPDIVIISSRATEKLAVLASLMSENLNVLVIQPLFETPAGPESVPNLFGQMQYVFKNYRIERLNCDVGIHIGLKNRLACVCLHSFQYYFDANQIANETQLKMNFAQMMTETSLDFGAELMLQRALILKDFTQNLLQKLNIPPSLVLCTQGFAQVVGLSIQQFYSHFLVAVQIRAQVPVLFQQPKFVLWNGINPRNIFENKNDINGYKIFNQAYILELLNVLMIQQNKLIDPYKPGTVFSARGGLMGFEAVATTQEINDVIKQANWLNWIDIPELYVTKEESISGVIQVLQFIRDIM